MNTHPIDEQSGRTASDPDVLETVKTHLQRLRYGSIAITVHNGKIVQLDVTEKTRLA